MLAVFAAAFRNFLHRCGIGGLEMKKIKNTLYVFTEDAYLTLDGENVVAKVGNDALGRFAYA